MRFSVQPSQAVVQRGKRFVVCREMCYNTSCYGKFGNYFQSLMEESYGRFFWSSLERGLHVRPVLRDRLSLSPGHRRAGMAVYDREKGFDRAIHNIENSPFRTKFDKDVASMKGGLGIGCISDYEPSP